jgi:hypothetical protein
MIAIVRRRRIDTLTVVAGPTSAGKSTFIEKLQSSPELRKQVGIPDTIDLVASYKLYHQPPTEPLGHVLFHYDILRPFGRALRTHERDPVLSLLTSARQVNVLTIKTSSERLIEQITTGEPEASPRHQKIKKLYGDPEFLKRWYGSWGRFIKSLPNTRSVIVENDGEFRVRNDSDSAI